MSQKLATIVQMYCFDKKPKRKVKEIPNKYMLPINIRDTEQIKENHEV